MKFFYYPIFLILLIVAIDKIALIGNIRDYSSNKSKSYSFKAFPKYGLDHLKSIREKMKNEGKKNAIFIGSSEVYGFLGLNKALKNDTYLTAEEKERVSNVYTFHGFNAPGIDFFSSLIILENIISHEYAPDLIVYEISPFFFNESYVRSKWYETEFSLRFLMDNFNYLPNDLKTDAITQILFPSYRYRFSLPEVIPNLITNRKNNSEINARIEHSNMVNISESADLSKVPSMSGEIARSKFKAYYSALSAKDDILVDSLFYKFKVHDGFWKIFINEINRARKKGIKVVVWLPATHETFRNFINSKYKVDEVFVSKLKTVLDSEKIPFFNANSVVDKCDIWNDTVHINVKCYSIIASEIYKLAF